MRNRFAPCLFLLLGTALVIGCGGGGGHHDAAAPEPPAEQAAPAPAPTPAAQTAVAKLQGREGSGVEGSVELSAIADGVHISARVSGLGAAGSHGFHVHEVGDCSAADFTSAGGHFNPSGAIHGGPDDSEHHAGDLGNIEVGEDGTGTLHANASMLTIADGPSSVVGRAIILHEGTDDFASQPTGAAGARLACGVVERVGG